MPDDLPTVARVNLTSKATTRGPRTGPPHPPAGATRVASALGAEDGMGLSAAGAPHIAFGCSSYIGGVAVLRFGSKNGVFTTVAFTLWRTASTVTSIWTCVPSV